MGLQFQRGLSDGDWELEERVTKKSCGAGRRSVYTVLIQAAKMEIPVKRCRAARLGTRRSVRLRCCPRRDSVVWSGDRRSRPIRWKSEVRKPSA